MTNSLRELKEGQYLTKVARDKYGKPYLENEGSLWFRRLKRELPKIDKRIRLKRIKFGFYKVFWKQAYVHEVFKEMPSKGYDFEDYDPRLENRSYYEEYEDHVKMIRTIKNFKEGYYDSIDRIRTRMYLMKNSNEHYENSQRAYQHTVIR